MTPADRILATLGALAGLTGVALAAAAAHRVDAPTLETAARFLLLHAPALLAVAALAGAGLLRAAPARLAGLTLALGLALFAGDLALRALAGRPLFPLAAPIGGVLLMGGWGLLAVAALIPARRA